MTPPNPGELRYEIAGFSEQGPRPENQDAFVADRFEIAGLVALADGMGGERGGRVAADTALATILAAAPIRSIDDARRAVREADRAVAAAAEAAPDQHGGMGCALGLLARSDDRDGPGWIAAHVGDVRILSRSPDGVIRLETRDHTPAFGRWEAGEISLDQIPDSSGANRLQRAVGRGGEADATWLPAGAGWSWILISDGVYKAMRLDEISRAMARPSAEETCAMIREKVQERGPDDNFTAVIVRALEPQTVSAGTISQPAAEPMSRTNSTRGSATGGIALALALLALVVAGFALLGGGSEGTPAASPEEVQQLRMDVDSLRAQLNGVIDPFGPTAPTQTPGAADTLQPATLQ